MSKKNIIVVPYNPEWPLIFEREARKIKDALGDNLIALHHIGSTSVPGLDAKPVIDMIGVIKKPERCIPMLEQLGFTYKGEYNVPMRFFFSRDDGIDDMHLHAYEEGHPEIELNIAFRDYLREHEEARDEYANLKYKLLQETASFERKNAMFTGYNLGKDAFIRKVLKATYFNRVRMLRCAHYAEWDAAKQLADIQEWTINHKDHIHLILYQGIDIIGYAHIELLEDKKSLLRTLVIDKSHQDQGFDKQFIDLCERWLQRQ